MENNASASPVSQGAPPDPQYGGSTESVTTSKFKFLKPLVFLATFALIALALFLYLRGDETSSTKKPGGSSSEPVSQQRTDTGKCNVSFRDKTIDVCDNSYRLFHRYNKYALFDDNGNPTFEQTKVGETEVTKKNDDMKILPGSNGNFIIMSNKRKLVAYQATPAARRYPPVKTPTDGDTDSNQVLISIFADTKDDKKTLVGSISAANVVHEWKIVQSGDYVHIMVPDAPTTGANVKKFVGAKLRLAYYPGGGFDKVVSFQSPIIVENASVIFTSVSGAPAYRADELSGDNMDQFLFIKASELR
jgi:hypothetical protein